VEWTRNLYFCIQLGNERTSRVASRFGDKFVNALNMLLLTLPGTALTYYGEELGMIDALSTVRDALLFRFLCAVSNHSL